MTTTPPEPPPEDERPAAAPGTPGGSAAPPPPPAGGGYGAPDPGQAAPAPGYGTPPAGYGAPGQGYGAAGQGYGDPAGYPAGAPGPGGTYADWPKRAYSALIDFVGPSLVAAIFYRASGGLGTLLYLAALAWAIYNAYLGGSTGQSYGKKIAGTRLILEATGQPPGGGLGIGRYFLHILDALPCYVGFLWPLWDSKRQTFADKIVKTVVVTV
jgi:uncharacterized RDD family membrane protein YckC